MDFHVLFGWYFPSHQEFEITVTGLKVMAISVGNRSHPIMHNPK